MQHIEFREESRYPGFYYRGDFMGLDDSKWKCFVNSKYDPAKKEIKIFKRAYWQIIPD
jgi:adenylylsulfate reductase subunit A